MEEEKELIEQEVPETPEVQEEQQEQPKESEAELNYRKLREERGQLRKENAEYQYRLQMLEQSQEKQPKDSETEEDYNLGDEDIVEGKHYSKLKRKIKHMEEKLQEASIRAKYHDFDEVVNVSTLAELNKRHPAIVSSLNNTRDLYSKASAAYDLIKKMGILEDRVPEQKSRPNYEEQALEVNSRKPRSSASVSAKHEDKALSRANEFASGGLTDELREHFYKEALKNSGAL